MLSKAHNKIFGVGGLNWKKEQQERVVPFYLFAALVSGFFIPLHKLLHLYRYILKSLRLMLL